MDTQQLKDLINELVKQPKESEWVEFKLNFHSAEEIGETISDVNTTLNNLNNTITEETN